METLLSCDNYVDLGHIIADIIQKSNFHLYILYIFFKLLKCLTILSVYVTCSQFCYVVDRTPNHYIFVCITPT